MPDQDLFHWQIKDSQSPQAFMPFMNDQGKQEYADMYWSAYQADPTQPSSEFLNHPCSLSGHPSRNVPLNAASQPTSIPGAWFNNAGASRINTDIHMYNVIKQAHPEVTVIDTNAQNVNILAYVASGGEGTVQALSTDNLLQTSVPGSTPSHMSNIIYAPPYRRMSGGTGALLLDPLFEKFLVTWHNQEFLIYLVDHRDGVTLFPQKRQYLLTSDPSVAYTLIRSAGLWTNTLHGEIWVFNQGFWQKDAALWQAIQKSRWEDIILPEDLKEDLLETVQRFYDSHEQYQRLRVPWKRGLIFYGPPGNGKTVSIKATMKTLYDRKDPIPTLYVKSLTSFAGPEYSIMQIFNKAQQEAPCYLVFEDLDSLVTDQVRSFFLNAVDGLAENEGILMVGSTNHLDKLDPGIAKRPSRFDRKYKFPLPRQTEREKYCKYWQTKLQDNDDVEYPDLLIEPIAKEMDGFSFAYMQEAFISALLKIANESDQHAEAKTEKPLEEQVEQKFTDGLLTPEQVTFKKADTGDVWDMVMLEKAFDGACTARPLQNESKEKNTDLNKYRLWREIKKQIDNLKKELDRGAE